LRSDLVNRNPRSNLFKHNLSVSYNHLAESLRAQGQHDRALASYQHSYDTRKNLLTESPRGQEFLNDIKESLDGLIQTSYLLPSPTELTIRYSEERFAIHRKLIASNHEDRYQRSCLFHELQTLGDVYLLQGRRIEAKRLYQEAQRLSEEEHQMGWSGE